MCADVFVPAHERTHTMHTGYIPTYVNPTRTHTHTHTQTPTHPHTHLVANEVDGVVRVAVLEQEVRVDRPRHHTCLEAAQPFEPRIARGDGPHGHGVEEIHVL